MYTKTEIIKILKREFPRLVEQFSVKKIAVFGSCARGHMRKTSDVDILVDFKVTPDLFKFLVLEEFLSGLLKRKVDLTTRRALKPLIRKNILREVIKI